VSVYYLLQGASTTSLAPTLAKQPVNPVIPPPPSPGTGSPITNIGLALTVQAPGGTSCGAVVTVVASNDYSSAVNSGNWATLTTITIASAVGPQTTLVSMVSPYNAYGAYMPTITGAGATVTCSMSA
jgi:hypothetical protein